MAPPIPRPPARPARRTPADVLVGVGAVLLLVVLTAGVPAALVTVLGSPIPHSVPSLSLLTHRLDILAIVKILSLVVWLAWLQLVLCVFAEVRAALRNTGMPSRVPLAGGVQPMVHRLVTTALLLSSAAIALSPAFAHPAASQAARHVSAALETGSGTASGSPSPAPSHPARPGPRVSQGMSAPGGGPAETQAFSVHRVRRTEKIYVVQPPDGRYHESLWEIAQNHLGDGRRYREIFDLNKDRVQPDGSKLTIASLIRPGWILRMPRDARGPGIKVVTLAEHAHGAHGRDLHPGHEGGRRDRDDGAAGPGSRRRPRPVHRRQPRLVRRPVRRRRRRPRLVRRPVRRRRLSAAPRPSASPSASASAAPVRRPVRRRRRRPRLVRRPLGVGVGPPRAPRPARPQPGPPGQAIAVPSRLRPPVTPRPGSASPRFPTSLRPLRCWPPACSQHSGGGAASSCGGAPSAGGWPPPWDQRRQPKSH